MIRGLIRGTVLSCSCAWLAVLPSIPNQRQDEVVSVGSHQGLARGPRVSSLIVCEEDCLSGGFGEEGRHLDGGASGEKAFPAVSSNSM